MSTPSNSDSGNISPASITIMSSPQRRAMQFMPNSPSPPRGTICNFPDGIEVLMLAQARSELGLRSWFAEGQKGDAVLEKHRHPMMNHRGNRPKLSPLSLP